MLRRTVVAAVIGLSMVIGSAGYAQAAQPAAVRAATTTPVVEAGTGVATFVATGLPSGPAVLQRFDTAKRAWVKAAAVAKKGSRGTASVSGLAPGLNKFRITASGRKSSVMTVKAMSLFNGPGEVKLFGSVTFPLQTVSGVQAAFNLSPVHECTYVNLAMGPVSGNFSGWFLDALILSEGFGPRNVRTDTGTGILQTDIPVSGVTTITFTQSNTSINQFGLQAHCLTNPF